MFLTKTATLIFPCPLSSPPPTLPPEKKSHFCHRKTTKIIHKTLPILRAGGTSDCIITPGTRRHVNGFYFYSQLPFLSAGPNQKKIIATTTTTTLLSLLLKQVPMLSNYSKHFKKIQILVMRGRDRQT